MTLTKAFDEAVDVFSFDYRNNVKHCKTNLVTILCSTVIAFLVKNRYWYDYL